MRNWIIIALILLVVGLVGAGRTMGNEGFFNFGSVEIDQQQAMDATGVKHIVLSFNSLDVTTVKGSTNEIKASLTGKVSKKFLESTKLNISRKADTITVSVDTKNGFTFGLSILDLELRLELPEQQYESITMDNGSGNINVAELAAQTIKIKNSSGNVQLNKLTANKLTLNVSSGSSQVTNVSANSAELDGYSGNITIEKLTAQKLSVKAGSGNVKMIDVDAELVVKAASGNIRAEQQDIKRPMDLSTGSGNVTINTDEKPASVEFNFTAGSGTFRNQWDKNSNDDHKQNIRFGDGSTPVRVHTGSGNFTIGGR
ncbi:DUF4097 family beta strand repeat-containing protein [Cohnella abietis]|uniref:DUF4097 domain-containing protein n=1 Tax=Cohnella abietis TaxID=2507935 RepID=A0A3T1D839_9BACL|nr:DUF4097 family beta strand repeat-containing protein [Cohnella abietis]BBI34238.1 hypothetical protein KCTCHS21_36370 [Cohnella abietis]